MSNLANVVEQLKKESDQAQRRIEQIGEALKALGGTRRAARNYQKTWRRAQASRGQRRTMSAGARKRIAAAHRARWAKWRAAQRQEINGRSCAYHRRNVVGCTEANEENGVRSDS